MSAQWSLDADFVKAVHTALKRIHRDRALSQHPLIDLAAVNSRCLRNGWPDTDIGCAASLRSTLEEALQALDAQNPSAATLLEERFLHSRAVASLAREQHVAESTLYARQRRALYALARILWSMEQCAREKADARKGHLTRNLPSPTYSRLFGRDEMLARLRAEMSIGAGPRRVCLEGLPGLGKTALAHRFATQAASRSCFADIVWVTAQERRFTPWSGIVGQPTADAAVTVEFLLDSIARQLGLDDLPPGPVRQKADVLRRTLRDAPCLVIVDNLGMTAELHATASRLWSLVNPAHLLFTSCHSLADHSPVCRLRLGELSEEDSLQLIRWEGRERGIHTVAGADDRALQQTYRVTGGHPLAIKMVILQARSIPLGRALHQLQDACGQRSEDLYRFIYQRSWEQLSTAGRRVLLAMRSLPATGGSWDDLLAASGLPQDILDPAVHEVAGMCLLNVGGVDGKQYTIHQLTYTFMSGGMVARWMETSQTQKNDPFSGRQ